MIAAYGGTGATLIAVAGVHLVGPWFGWSAQTPFEEGMRRTIEWFKENREKVR